MLRISSDFGPRINPVTHQEQFHTGIDLPQPEGSPVLACVGGTVSRVDVLHAVNGNAIHIAGDDGRRWSYLHLSEVRVAEGEGVWQGQLIGAVGATGRATGPHLHLQVAEDGVAVDPEGLFPPGTFGA